MRTHPSAQKAHARLRRLARIEPTLGVRALLLLFAVAVVSAASPPAGDGQEAPQDGLVPEGCLAGVVTDGLGFTPGDLRQARSLRVTETKSVQADNDTILRGIALGTALGKELNVQNLTSWRKERWEVCSFDRAATSDRDQALLSRALGESGNGSLADARVLVVFRTIATQNVTLGADTAMAALAMEHVGSATSIEDLIDVERDVRTERILERNVTLEREDTLVELVLREAREAAPAPVPLAANVTVRG